MRTVSEISGLSLPRHISRGLSCWEYAVVRDGSERKPKVSGKNLRWGQTVIRNKYIKFKKNKGMRFVKIRAKKSPCVSS